MRFDVVTLFPEMFTTTGVVARGVDEGRLAIHTADLRAFGIGKHRSVDDTPYGGGAGMVMRVDCIVACLEALPMGGRRILLTPRGARFDQGHVQRLAAYPAITLVCGRYEGFDERVKSYIDEELSLGDFVLSGGEIAAMAIIDAIARTLPGVLGNPESLAEESHDPANSGLLEYPQYTRPAEFRGERVPDVLMGGNHARIAEWRRQQQR